MNEDSYEWDERKNAENKKKHGVSFKLASEIFQGLIFTKLDDRENYDEERWISIGQTGNTIILLVAHTDRNGRTRIISARKASRTERKSYYENLEKTYEGIRTSIESEKTQKDRNRKN